MVGCGVVGVQSNRLTILAFCSCPVPICLLLQDRKCGMRFGQRGIEFDRPLHGAADLGRGFVIRNYPAIEEKYVRICQPSIGLCVIWIFGNRLVELIQCLVKAVARTLRQVKASFHIELVGFGILGGMPFLFATYL